MAGHNYQYNGTVRVFIATHKNAQSQLVTVQCSLCKCQPEKSKV